MMMADFTSIIADLRTSPHPPIVGVAAATVVLISGDNDFIKEVSAATQAGAAVHVLRHRLAGNERAWMEQFAASVTYWEDVVPVGGGGARVQGTPAGAGPAHAHAHHHHAHAASASGAGYTRGARRARARTRSATPPQRAQERQPHQQCRNGRECRHWAAGNCKFQHSIYWS